MVSRFATVRHPGTLNVLTDNRDPDRPDGTSATDDGADGDLAADLPRCPSAEVASARPTDDDYVDL